MSFELATNSPLESRLTKLILKTIESGYMKRGEDIAFELIRTHAVFSALRSNTTAGDTNNSLIMSYVSTKIFTYIVVFCACYLIAIVVFAAEIVYFTHSNNVQKKQRSLPAKRHSQVNKRPSYRRFSFEPTYLP